MLRIYILVLIQIPFLSYSQDKPSLKYTSNSDSLFIKGVQKIPPEVFNQTKLIYLSVWGQDCDVPSIPCMAISKVPTGIKHLKNLKELHLVLNYIHELPPEILELKKLEVLDLTENPNFKDVQTVMKMNWLKQFTCYGCHLSTEDVTKLKTALPSCLITTE